MLKVQNKIHVLHISFEYGAATLGGLGAVTTQMVAAQNAYKYNGENVYEINIITPLYTPLYSCYNNLDKTDIVEHTYNHQKIKSIIYMHNDGKTRHFMVAPDAQFSRLFSINFITDIYSDCSHSLFTDRMKYFNSAVSAYIAENTIKKSSFCFEILILHEWHCALCIKLINEIYNTKIYSIFILHVSNYDCGIYHSPDLFGIGLELKEKYIILKLIALQLSDKIVAVSPSFLLDSLTTTTDNMASELLRKALVIAKILDNKVSAILNGFEYNKFCLLYDFQSESEDISATKYKIKKIIAEHLQNCKLINKINCDLPVILYIGRFSNEKGIDTFSQLIDDIQNKAIFFALGRGTNKIVSDLMHRHNNITNNVFISANESIQAQFGKMMRACADFTFVPSHQEACGLVPMEGFANAAMCITTGVGGIKDIVTELDTGNLDNITGNGFIYQDLPFKAYNPFLSKTINTSLTFWSSLSKIHKNTLQLRLIEDARKFDWLSENGAVSKYVDLFDEAIRSKDQNKLTSYQ